MEIFVNDHSFSDPLPDSSSARAALEEMTKIAALAIELSNGRPIKRTRNLKNAEILANKSLIVFIIELTKEPKYQKVAALFLDFFAKAPFVEGHHQEVDSSVVDVSGICVKGTSLDEASSLYIGAAVISLTQADGLYLKINSSRFGIRNILNLSCSKITSSLIWRYDDNPKHRILKDKMVNGEIHSAMKLDLQSCQRTLSNRLLVGNSVYSRVDGQWYKFNCHKDNLFHGFPINVKTSYKDFATASRVFDRVGINAQGQLLWEQIADHK